MSKTINLGRVALKARGRWSESESYESLDAVYHDNALWIAKKESMGEIPVEESEYWEIALEAVQASGDSSTAPEVPDTSEQAEELVAFLPDDIYVATGITIELYNRNICPSVGYHFRWICDIGRVYSDKYSIEGSSDNMGDHSLTLEITNNNAEIVYTKQVTVHVVPGTVPSYKEVCGIGGVHSADKKWLASIYDLSENITFVGSLVGDNGKHEGRAGWTSYDYTHIESKVDPVTSINIYNPFTIGTTFSWDVFINDSIKGNPNAVQLFFGDGELISGTGKSIAQNLDIFIQGIRQTSNLPIFIVLPPCFGDADGFEGQKEISGGVDLDGLSKYDVDRLIIKGAKELYDEVKSAGYTNVYFIPVTQCHDSEHNFETVEQSINPRSNETVRRVAQSLVPTDEGYKQMGDVMYSAYCAAFNS